MRNTDQGRAQPRPRGQDARAPIPADHRDRAGKMPALLFQPIAATARARCPRSYSSRSPPLHGQDARAPIPADRRHCTGKMPALHARTPFLRPFPRL